MKVCIKMLKKLLKYLLRLTKNPNQISMKILPNNTFSRFIYCKLYVALCTLLIVNCTMLIVHCPAQTVSELLEVAVKENKELKVLETEYQVALQKAPQVNERPDPEIGIGIFPLPVETRLGPQVLRIGATQMFPWKGLLSGKKNLELAKSEALYERVNIKILEIRYALEQAYFELYEIEKTQEILRRNLVIFSGLENMALAKVESGKSSAVDVLRVQLKTKELLQEIEILENSKAKPRVTINQLLQRNLDIPIDVVDTLEFAKVLLSKEEMLKNIEANHPTLKMFELEKEVSQQAIELNKLNNKPLFGVGLDYIMVNKRNDAEPQKNGRDIIQIRGSIKIPLYKKKYEAKEKEESLKINALEYRKSDLVNHFSAIIEKGIIDFENARLRLELYQEQIKITKSALNILETNYSVKGSNFEELLRLEKELIEYDLKILKAVVQSHLAKSTIERFIRK